VAVYLSKLSLERNRKALGARGPNVIVFFTTWPVNWSCSGTGHRVSFNFIGTSIVGCWLSSVTIRTVP
jgi:hypothetical protein